jgi:hypothetical protein
MDLTGPNKLNQPTVAAGGALSAESTVLGQGTPAGNKNIKMTTLVIVNTNDGK